SRARESRTYPDFHQMPDDRALLLDELLDAVVRKIEERHEGVAPERIRLRGALHLDESSVARLDDIHIHIRAAVIVVRQVEQGLAVDDADAGGGDVVVPRNAADRVAR